MNTMNKQQIADKIESVEGELASLRSQLSTNTTRIGRIHYGDKFKHLNKTYIRIPGGSPPQEFGSATSSLAGELSRVSKKIYGEGKYLAVDLTGGEGDLAVFDAEVYVERVTS